jgi:hypothetical protein
MLAMVGILEDDMSDVGDLDGGDVSFAPTLDGGDVSFSLTPVLGALVIVPHVSSEAGSKLS